MVGYKPCTKTRGTRGAQNTCKITPEYNGVATPSYKYNVKRASSSSSNVLFCCCSQSTHRPRVGFTVHLIVEEGVALRDRELQLARHLGPGHRGNKPEDGRKRITHKQSRSTALPIRMQCIDCTVLWYHGMHAGDRTACISASAVRCKTQAALQTSSRREEALPRETCTTAGTKRSGPPTPAHRISNPPTSSLGGPWSQRVRPLTPWLKPSDSISRIGFQESLPHLADFSSDFMYSRSRAFPRRKKLINMSNIYI